MRIELAPDLPDDAAEALDAEGRLITRFAPDSERCPDGTAAVRISSAAFERIATAVAELNAAPPRKRSCSAQYQPISGKPESSGTLPTLGGTCAQTVRILNASAPISMAPLMSSLSGTQRNVGPVPSATEGSYSKPI